MRNIIFFIGILLLGWGCKNSALNTSVEFEKQLANWKFNTSVSIYESQDSLLSIEIFFLKDSVKSLNSYFLDTESNKVLMAMISENFYEYLKDYSKINYLFHFDNQKDMENFQITLQKKDLVETHKQFQQNPLFYDFVEYSFKEVGSVDIVRAEAWLEYLSEESNLWDFSGSYWDLLYEYSKGCSNHSENLKAIYHFIAFVGVVDNPSNTNSINSKKLNYFIEYCDLDSNLTKKSLPDLIKFLDKDFVNK